MKSEQKIEIMRLNDALRSALNTNDESILNESVYVAASDVVMFWADFMTFKNWALYDASAELQEDLDDNPTYKKAIAVNSLVNPGFWNGENENLTRAERFIDKLYTSAELILKTSEEDAQYFDGATS